MPDIRGFVADDVPATTRREDDSVYDAVAFVNVAAIVQLECSKRLFWARGGTAASHAEHFRTLCQFHLTSW